MKFAVFIFLICTINITYADDIGKRCYQVVPPNAPSDIGIEVLWIKETSAGVFNGSGYHQDLVNNRTPIHSTSFKNQLGTYDRFVYGSLGPVGQEIAYSEVGDVEAISNMPSHSDIFFSHSVLIPDSDGNLQGTFRADDYYQTNQIYSKSGINDIPGTIYSISCP